MTTMNETALNETGPLEPFRIWYASQHGYSSLVVCVFGIISNVLNVIVLVQKNMISPFNFLLVGVAIADIVTMAVYVPFSIHFFFYHTMTEPHMYGWIIYLLFSNAFILTAHTVALWLTVSLAVFRYIVVCHHVHGPRLCNLRRAKITTIIVTISSVVVCVPNFFNYVIIPVENDSSLYKIDWSHLNKITNGFWFKLTIWLYVVFFKTAPCTFLLILSALLIRTMKMANKRRMRLLSNRQRNEVDHTSNEHNRTTNMLVVVVVFFALADLPQGIVAFMGMLDNELLENYYSPLGDVFDELVLINSAVNFILYCIMSHQFRTTFTDIFLSKLCRSTHDARKAKVVTANGTDYTVVVKDSTDV